MLAELYTPVTLTDSLIEAGMFRSGYPLKLGQSSSHTINLLGIHQDIDVALGSGLLIGPSRRPRHFEPLPNAASGLATRITPSNHLRVLLRVC